MIQDIFPHKLHNEYIPGLNAGDSDVAISVNKGEILINTALFEEKRIEFPKVSLLGEALEYVYLFTVDETRYFLVLDELKEIPSGYGYVKDRGLRIEEIGPDYELFAAITAKHLSDWYRDTLFCGRCGLKMKHSATERAMTCECGYTAYPRIMPAVIVGVKNGEKLLLTKYNRGFAHNALIAGFTEIGETAEETVAREVMEEAGVKVKNIKYYKSQPWGSANDLLLGFYCELDGDETITMDSNELKYAEWVKREDIVLQPGSFSLTNEMMKRFKDGVER